MSAPAFATLPAPPYYAVVFSSLRRDDGVTEVRFLAAGKSVVELYEPPALRGTVPDFADNAFWRGLRLIGSGHPAGLRTGPDGLRVTIV